MTNLNGRAVDSAVLRERVSLGVREAWGSFPPPPPGLGAWMVFPASLVGERDLGPVVTSKMGEAYWGLVAKVRSLGLDPEDGDFHLGEPTVGPQGEIAVPLRWECADEDEGAQGPRLVAPP